MVGHILKRPVALQEAAKKQRDAAKAKDTADSSKGKATKSEDAKEDTKEAEDKEKAITEGDTDMKDAPAEKVRCLRAQQLAGSCACLPCMMVLRKERLLQACGVVKSHALPHCRDGSNCSAVKQSSWL